MKKILILTAVLSAFVFQSCHREGFPSGEMTSQQLKSNPASAEYMTLGNYAMFKEPIAYLSEDEDWPLGKNTYMRQFFFMTEFRGDNISLSYITPDELAKSVTYTDTPELINLSHFWFVSYRIIFGANAVIESLSEGVSSELDHMKGENYFLRAVSHLNLVTMYANPYSHGANNPGVIIRTSTDTSVTERATVGKVYEQIEADLLEAIRLMGKSSAPRMGNNKGFASKAAAQGVLSRVLLHMGRDADVITLVDEMLAGAAPSSKLHADIAAYYPNTLTSAETLWAIGMTLADVGSDAGAKIASMYFTDEKGRGWGQIYYSDLLLDLYHRYPEDQRLKLCVSRLRPGKTEDDRMIRFDIPNSETVYYAETHDALWDAAQQKYYYMDGANKIVVQEETVNTYKRNYIMLNGEKKTARLSQAVTLDALGARTPMFYMTKFSYQDGDGMLASPAMIRWGEVILNRAEAYAKTNQNDKALADVNTIRGRAGLTGDALFTEANYEGRGYDTVLDVVLDERRLELCFEGHRAIDQFRNNKPIDRRYAGAQDYEVIEPGDPRFPHRIPADEIRVSAIPQND